MVKVWDGAMDRAAQVAQQRPPDPSTRDTGMQDRIIAAMRAGGEMTRGDVARAVGRSASDVGSSMQILARHGIIEPTDHWTRASNGKMVRRYRIRD